MDIAALLVQPTGKTLEFKRDLSSPDTLVRTVVAFANTAGGTVAIGVEEKTRRIRGVEDPVLVSEQAAKLISSWVAPRLVPEIEVHPWRKTYLVTVRVYRTGTGPYHLTRLGAKDGVFVRVGATNCAADASVIAQIGRLARNESYDELPMVDCSAEDIDFDAAAAWFAPSRKLSKRDLTSLRVVAKHKGRIVPTIGGMLLFGRDRLSHFPDAYIQAGLFDGIHRARILDTVVISSLLPAAVDEAMAFVRKQLREKIVIGEGGSVRHRQNWSVPEVALREAIEGARDGEDPAGGRAIA